MGASDIGEVPDAKRAKMDDSLTISVGGKAQTCPPGSTLQQVLTSGTAIAARMDNNVVSLSKTIIGTDVKVEAIPLASPDGIRVLVETLKLMLRVGKHEALPDLAIIVGKPIGAAYYCMLSDKVTGKTHVPTEDELKKIRASMDRLIDDKEAFVERTVSLEHAIKAVGTTGAAFTSTILREYNEPQVNVVECRGLYHLPRHPVMPSAAMVPKESFQLTPFKDGFLLEHFRCDTKTKQARHWRYNTVESDLLYNEYMTRMQWAKDVELYTIAQLNSAIREGKSKHVIQAVEANCDRQFVEIAANVKARNNCKLLLVAGPSSSGKTTFAMRLKVQLESLGLKPVVLSVDSFYKAWKDITPEGPQKVDWEALDSLNLEQLNDVLLTLMSGKEALVPEYDMKTSMPMDKSHWTKMQLHQGGKGIIIMEGIHCLNPALTQKVPKEQKFNIAIAPIPALQLDAFHVLSGTTIRMLRRMVRDYLNRGRPVLATLKQWPGIAAGEVNNIYPHQHNADAVFNSEIGYEMNVLKVHAEPLLKTVSPNAPEYSEVRRLLHTLEQFISLPTNIIPPQSLLREFVGGSWYYDYGGWYKSY